NIVFNDPESADYSGRILYNHSVDDMLFYTDKTEQMRIDSNGNVGIGTTDPDNILTVAKSDTNTGVSSAREASLRVVNTASTENAISSIQFNHRTDADAQVMGMIGITYRSNDNNGAGDMFFATKAGNGVTDVTEYMRIELGGDVGIGDATPSYDLDVNANINYQGSLTNVSDIRYKKEIVTIDSALDKVNSLRGVTYKWRTDEFPDTNWSTSTILGVIAQEVEPIIPEIVFTADDGYKSVDYSKFTPVLINAIQELSSVFDSTLATTSTSTIMSLYQGTTTPAIAIDADGNVGVGTTSPIYKMHVVGDVAATGFVNISTAESKTDIEHITEEEQE
ncbi:MAG: tail fiber domain-containing protein, partial [Anaerolineales bacterium]|nr:tail fiber domain-containing protein [Anaerolineales bacterium]